VIFRYSGSELELFSVARNWKSYVSRLLEPYLGERILEVGAGIGSNVPYLCRPGTRLWVALEPDVDLAARIKAKVSAGLLPSICRVIEGTVAQIPVDQAFDTILYLDVLEHIGDDTGELVMAARLLAPGGYLVVLSPAHQWLFSPFDAAVGHLRRYNRAGLGALCPPGCQLSGSRLLDSVGLLASLANRLLLCEAHPSSRQITIWDRALVPLSSLADKLLGYRVGKSVLAIWQRSEEAGGESVGPLAAHYGFDPVRR
jgi:SAM-dependent methyltransferase